MEGNKKKSIDKMRQDANYAKLSQRDADLLLVYEDKTILLFGDPEKKKKLRTKSI